jgi:hypothetical protein
VEFVKLVHAVAREWPVWIFQLKFDGSAYLWSSVLLRNSLLKYSNCANC